MHYVTTADRLKNKLAEAVSARDKIESIYNYVQHVIDTRSPDQSTADFLHNELKIIDLSLQKEREEVKQICSNLGHRRLDGGSAVQTSPYNTQYCLICRKEWELS
ncbi:hypothetical protein [Exiguobacterium sp. s37]|uniref:hypothetical protein n=1 Tax=Exiguobacterium sp. s37 TaxID=2751275 RepID=UPI001BEBCE1C|nr:hypothetical protein [Exiguobacterium sp. s37]